MTTTRADHLAWCKQRALEYVDAGDLQNAFASMASDLGKHPETAGHDAIELADLGRLPARFARGSHVCSDDSCLIAAQPAAENLS